MRTISRYFTLLTILTLTPSLARASHAAELSFGCDLALEAPQKMKPSKLRIARLKSAAFYPHQNVAAIFKDADLLFLDRPTIQNIRDAQNADAGYFLSPTQVRWMRPIEELETFLNELLPTERGHIENQLAISQNLVRAEAQSLTLEDFRKWHKIYRKSHAAKGQKSLPIKSDWAKKLGSRLKYYDRLFLYDKKSGDLLGGIILEGHHDRIVALHEAYSSEAQPLKPEVRAFAEVMEYGAKCRYPTLEYVQDSLVGQFSPTSSVAFKASLKMHPYPNGDRRLVKILNPNILNRDFLIFAFNFESLVAHHFTDRPDAVQFRRFPFFPLVTVQVHDLRDALSSREEN